MEENALQL